MGNLCGGSKTKTTTEAEKQVKDRKKEMSKEIKLLLLGSGESGKSTFFKQIKYMYDNGYEGEELKAYKSSIYANILGTISALAQGIAKKDLQYENPENKALAKKIVDIVEADTQLLLTASSVYTPEIHEAVKQVWSDNVVKKVFNDRYEFHVFDGAQYFLENLDSVVPPSYVPTKEDILRCRRKTTGVTEIKFIYNEYNFIMVDVGGQRNERKKWLHCFQGVTCVIFVVSLSDYDQKCYEDDTTNRMVESLELFDSIVNGQHFKETPIMLFLNKTDLFKEKIKKTDLKIAFPEYDGGKDYSNATKFIEQKFLDINKFDPQRIRTFYTCATDSQATKQAFEMLKESIVQFNKGTPN